MKKLIYLVFTVLIVSCSSNDNNILGCTEPDSINYNSNATEDDGSCLYSVVGVWKTTSAILNGTEVFGDAVKSEYYFMYDANDDFFFGTESYSDLNSTVPLSYSIGTWSLPTSQSFNTNADVYDTSHNYIANYNITWTITEIDAVVFEMSVNNYPNSGDVYTKRLVKTSIALPQL